VPAAAAAAAGGTPSKQGQRVRRKNTDSMQKLQVGMMQSTAAVEVLGCINNRLEQHMTRCHSTQRFLCQHAALSRHVSSTSAHHQHDQTAGCLVVVAAAAVATLCALAAAAAALSGAG
jgi:hypothetical protein